MRVTPLLSLCPQAQAEAGKASSVKRLPTVAGRPPAPSTGTPSTSHTLPKAGAGSLFNSLQRREQARAEQARLLTLQGIMGTSSLQPAPEERHGPSSTWPQKCGRRKGGPGAAAAGPQLGELLLYVRNPLVRDIDAECGAAPQDTHLPSRKTTCPHLSLGSVLSLELPRDPAVLGCHRGATVRPEEAEEQEQRQVRVQRPQEPTGMHGAVWQKKAAADGHSPQGPGEGPGSSPKSERGTWFEEVSFNPNHSWQRAHCAGEERWSPRHPGSTGEDPLDFRPSRLPRIGVLHKRVGWDGDELSARLSQDGSPDANGRARHCEAARLELGPSPAGTPGRAGAMPSPASTQRPAGSSQPQVSPASPAAPTQLSVLEWELGSPQPHSPASGTREVCHPAHGQFEEEEEELQAIWNGADDQQAPSIPAGSRAHHRPGSRAGSVPSPDTAAAGPLILSSASNVLVAKFTLPTAARLLHSPSGDKSPGTGHSSGGSPSRHRVSPRTEEPVSTASLDGPSAWDLQRCGEEAREGSKVRAMECPSESSSGLGDIPGSSWVTCCSELHPKSLQTAQNISSVVLFPPWHCRLGMGQADPMCSGPEMAVPEHASFTPVSSQIPPGKMEFQMMEGTLERKHLLQTGGRKVRAWLRGFFKAGVLEHGRRHSGFGA